MSNLRAAAAQVSMALSGSKAGKGGDGDAESFSSDAVASHVAHYCWKQRKRPRDPFDFNHDKGHMDKLAELRFMGRPQGPLPLLLCDASSARAPSPPKVLSSFLTAGGKPLTARDEVIKSKAVADERKAAVKKWVSLVGIDFQSWGIAKQALGSYKPEFATGGLVEPWRTKPHPPCINVQVLCFATAGFGRSVASLGSLFWKPSFTTMSRPALMLHRPIPDRTLESKNLVESYCALRECKLSDGRASQFCLKLCS